MDDRGPIVDDELKVRTWKDFELVEHAELGGLFLDKIWKRNLVDGSWDYTLVRFRVPREDELRAYRVLARSIAEKEGLDPEKDPTLFENLDVACILHHAVRDPTEPYAPLAMDPRDLEKRFNKAQLAQAWKKLEGYRELLDPTPGDISPDMMVALSAAIVRGRSIHPLRIFDSLSQATYVITMAELHVNSLTDKSSEE